MSNWVDLCRFFDYVKYGKFDSLEQKIIPPSSSYKKNQLEKIFHTHRAQFASDMWAVMNLLLPGYDTNANGDRATYGLGESGIANKVIKALDLPVNGVHAQRLLNWNTDKGGEGHGDLPRVLYSCLIDREHGKSKPAVLMVEQVDRFLKGLRDSNANNTDPQHEFTSMINASTPTEIKWIVAEILVDNIPLSRDEVLSAYHENAINLMDYNTDLREMTKLLSKRNAVGYPSLTLMKPFVPMCSRQLMREENLKQWFPGIFWAQEKFDGERIQIHKNGDVIKMFSRNAVDYTNLFRSAIRMITDKKALKATKCILDGEILAWDNFHGGFGPCSAVKTAAVATGGVMPHSNLHTTTRHRQDNGQWAIALRLYDALQIEDECIMKRPLRQRHMQLKNIVHEIPDLLQVVKLLTVSIKPNNSMTHELSTYDQAIKVMSSVVDNGSEGVVLKDPESAYIVGTRIHSKWVKLKPDYFENGGMGGNNDLDLLIVGAACGKGEDHLKHFLVALASDPLSEMENPERFLSFSHISTNMSREQSRELESIFKEHKIRVDFTKQDRIYIYNTPAVKFEWRNGKEYERQHVLVTWLKTDELPGVEVIYSGLKTEDVHWVFDPRRSVLVAVNADPGPIKAATFATKYTLRFPRLHNKGIRNPDEKAWYQCLKQSDWDALVMNFQHKSSTETGSATGAASSSSSETGSPAGAASSSSNRGFGALNYYKRQKKRNQAEQAEQKRKREANQPPEQQPEIKKMEFKGQHDRSFDKKKINMLDGWTIYVHNNDFDNRQILMTKAFELGAKVPETNPQAHPQFGSKYDHKKFAGISTNITSAEFVKCKKLNRDVVASKWLIDCWDAANKDSDASPIEIGPSYMLNTSEPV
jgi:ATP-dependent DNA ligase I